MTGKCFSKGIALFLACFKNIEITDVNIEMWKELLNDLSDDDFKYAIKKICNEVKEFYPTTNFVGLVRDQLKVEDNSEDKANLAWSEVMKRLYRDGKYASMKEKPVIEATIRAMGGWNILLHSQEKDIIYLQKQFVNIYKTMKKPEQSQLKLVVNQENIKKCDELVNDFTDKMGSKK